MIVYNMNQYKMFDFPILNHIDYSMEQFQNLVNFHLD